MSKETFDDFNLDDSVIMYEIYLEGIIRDPEHSCATLIDSGYTDYAEAEKCADYAFENYPLPPDLKLAKITVYSVLVYQNGDQEVLDCCYEKRFDKLPKKVVYF